MGMNYAAIMGRLVRDPELRRTQTGVAVASFTVAVDRDYVPQGQEREADFIDCVAWRQNGEFVDKYFKKGSMIVVVGRTQTRMYTDKDGNKRKASEISADRVYFGESRRREDGAENDNSEPSYEAPSADNYEQIEEEDGQLPF